MTENINDKLIEEQRPTKLQLIGAQACSDSSFVFMHTVNEIAKSGEMNEEQLMGAYAKSSIYLVSRFWELYCDNYPEIYEEICQHQEELKRKIN